MASGGGCPWAAFDINEVAPWRRRGHPAHPPDALMYIGLQGTARMTAIRFNTFHTETLCWTKDNLDRTPCSISGADLIPFMPPIPPVLARPLYKYFPGVLRPTATHHVWRAAPSTP